jgi:NAD+ kinase
MIADVLTHRRPDETGPALQNLLAVARSMGATLRFDERETLKHELVAAPGLEVGASQEPQPDVSLCFALGGDGTILSALRRYAGTGVPVFAINFGEIGFLATVDRESGREGIERAFRGEFDTLSLPGIALRTNGDRWLAINDISVQRQQGSRVANLAYSVGSDEIGRVRCDGLVVATPAGSTGYNLANGGPVMAWGVAGWVVSFIAPHSLTARALVVAPDDLLTIHNSSQDEEVDVSADGRPVTVLLPGGSLTAAFVADQGTLAQLEGINFYARVREKFGRLATLP